MQVAWIQPVCRRYGLYGFDQRQHYPHLGSANSFMRAIIIFVIAALAALIPGLIVRARPNL
jgi:hypothetical protein